MRKFLSITLSTVIIIGLASCSMQHNIKDFKKLSFEKPAAWQLVRPKDNYRYDYVFNATNNKRQFQIYLRVVYMPRKNAHKWLKTERKENLKQGNEVTKITTFSSKSFKWYMMQIEKIIGKKGKAISVNTRIYAAKEKRSPRLIQCYVVGSKNSFESLPEAEINTFLNTIALEKIKTQKKQAYIDENMFVCAEEAAYLKRGGRLVESGEYIRAINVFNSLLERNTTQKLKAQLYYLLSETYLEKGVSLYIKNKSIEDFQESINEAKQAIKIDKTHWQAYRNLALCYINMKEHSVAKQYLQKALKYCEKSNPEYPLLEFYLEVAKSPQGYKRPISSMFSKENKITGFIYDEQNPVVMISGKPYRQRDIIAGYRILKITSDRVYMEINNMLDEFTSGDMLRQPKKAKKSS